jgi:hypothetical protein
MPKKQSQSLKMNSLTYKACKFFRIPSKNLNSHNFKSKIWMTKNNNIQKFPYRENLPKLQAEIHVKITYHKAQLQEDSLLQAKGRNIIQRRKMDCHISTKSK